MTFTTKKLSPDSAELTVELSKDDLKLYLERSEADLGRDLEIDGFRKGKVPRDMIRKHVGDAKILEVALETAVQRSLAEAISEQNLDIIEANDLKVGENSPEKLVYTVVLKLFPEVKLPKLDTISVKRNLVTVEDKEIADTVETIKSSRAILSDKEGSAETGNRVEIDFEVTEQGKTIEGGVSKNHPLVIGAGNFIPGFEDQLIGMSKDGQKEFSLTAPVDFANKDIAGKKLEFKVTMHEIKTVTLPELTSDFAKQLGKFETVDQLISSVKDGLLEEKKEKENQRVRAEILDKIITTSQCVASPAMVDQQLTTMIQNFDQDLHRHDMELAMYLAKLGKTEDNLRSEWRAQAERQVKMAMVIHTIARTQNISITSEEVDEALQAVLQSAISPDGASPALDTERIRHNIESRLLNEKTFEYLDRTCISSS